MFLSEWREFPSVPCLVGKKKLDDLMTACVSKLLKSRASLACFRARFLPGRAKDLSAPRYILGSSVPLLQRAARRLYTCYSIPLSVGIVRHRKRCIYTPKIKGSVGTQFILFNLNIFKTNFVIQLTCYNTYILTYLLHGAKSFLRS